MSKQITGIHVFEKRKDDQWNRMSFAVQAISILSWKKFHGRIILYTNEEHLEDLRSRGLDKLYDQIDTELLKTAPRIDEKKYWAFGKIYVASVQTEPFVLIDTDLYLEKPLEFDESLHFQGYHFESFNNSLETNIYLDFDNSIPTKWLGRWNKTVLPINTAILYVRDLEFAKDWFSCASEIATAQSQIEVRPNLYSYYMTLIEQRLLTMLATEKNLTYGSFIKPVYLSYEDGTSGREWSPPIARLNPSDLERFLTIRHIWGLKSPIISDLVIRNLVFGILKTSYNKYPEFDSTELLKAWEMPSEN